MTDYSQYSYSNTLEILDGQHERDTDPTNYAEYLLNMSNTTSIKQCIKIYNRVYSKYCQLFSMGWSGHKDVDEDLAKCLNENIIRILKANKEATIKDTLCSLSNLRQCDEISNYQKEVITYARQREAIDNDAEKSFQEIIEAQKNYDEAINTIHYEYDVPGTNGYKKATATIEDSRATLKRYGYIACDSDYHIVSTISLFSFYFLIILEIIALVYYFGALFLIALPIIGWYALWKG